MRQDELQPAIDHRFPGLAPLLAMPLAGRIWRAVIRLFWLLYFAFVLLVLALRYLILPSIESYRPQ
ncbi:MAG: hypothetical protein IAE88_16060, partial [Rhodobacteraceae bacterium]|nr:hypothetical protein [Paracoccaceae bacterium]